MSVINEFECNRVLCHEPSKSLCMSGIDGDRYTFTYDIKCTATWVDRHEIVFFFNLKQSKCLFIYKIAAIFHCVSMKFWITNETTRSRYET